MNCILKKTHDNGRKLYPHEHELWCGGKRTGLDRVFVSPEDAEKSKNDACEECRCNIAKSVSEAFNPAQVKP